MINTLIVEDHQIVVDGLLSLLEGEEHIRVVNVALTGAAAIELAASTEIDLILLDINLPDKSGLEIMKTIRKQEATPPIKFIALTMHGELGYINKMSQAGVDGYLLKNTSRKEILQAIHTVMAGERYFCKEVTQLLVNRAYKPRTPKSTDFIQKLTRREKEILRLIVEEMTTDEIADKLHIGATTVISHRKSLLRKLNAKNTAGIVRAAFEFGLLNG